MGSKTGIEWADVTWGPWQGCTPVSDGCQQCYMYREKRRYGQDPTKIVRSSDSTFRMPMSRKRVPPGSFVFVCSWSDFFHPDVPDDWRHEAFGYMAYRYDVTFLLLTKRPQRMADYLGEWEPETCGALLANEFDHHPSKVTRHRLEQTVDWLHGEWCTDEYAMPPFDTMADACDGLPNVWLGVTAENQARADERIPQLLSIDWPGKRFVSLEPLLGPVDLSITDCPDAHSMLSWLICGGESGPRARPVHPDWVRSLRDQCHTAGVPFMFKQWGEWAPNCDHPPYPGKACASVPRPAPGKSGAMFRCGKKRAGRELDGREWLERPDTGKDGE